MTLWLLLLPLHIAGRIRRKVQDAKWAHDNIAHGRPVGIAGLDVDFREGCTNRAGDEVRAQGRAHGLSRLLWGVSVAGHGYECSTDLYRDGGGCQRYRLPCRCHCCCASSGLHW